MMKVLITGKNGQLGYELRQQIPENINVVLYGAEQLNITDIIQVRNVLSSDKPDVVINAAAYTAVDKAESQKEQAFLVNEVGCENLAKICKEVGAKLIHVSTDFVFDGSAFKPYTPSDKTNPISLYGASKLAGEVAIHQIIPNDFVIIRTAWVYSIHGQNFVKTMLRLFQEKDRLEVVYDQVGTPTWAAGLARVIWQLAKEKHKINGQIFHWTDAGVTSWYDFAVAIQTIGLSLGLLEKEIPIKAIPGSAYPTAATRPHYSVLDKSAIEAYLNVNTVHWQQQLLNMLKELK